MFFYVKLAAPSVNLSLSISPFLHRLTPFTNYGYLNIDLGCGFTHHLTDIQLWNRENKFCGRSVT